MVAGQSCIAGPSVFPPPAALNLAVCYVSSLCRCKHTRCQQTLPAGDWCVHSSCVLCTVLGSVGCCRHATQCAKVSCLSEAAHRHSPHYCQATCHFFYISLAVCTEQAFLCLQRHLCLDISGAQLPWMFLARISTCADEPVCLYVQ
jgi:hypothetical protein